MTTTATNTTTTTARSAVSHGRRVRRIVVAAGLTAAFAGTAALAISVLRDDAPDNHTPAVVVVAPYNGLPNVNDLGVNPAPTPTIVVPGPYNGLPNLNDLGVTVPTVAARTGR
jgi:hypothetical protein